jgi:hypothetical protein
LTNLYLLNIRPIQKVSSYFLWKVRSVLFSYNRLNYLKLLYILDCFIIIKNIFVKETFLNIVDSIFLVIYCML